MLHFCIPSRVSKHNLSLWFQQFQQFQEARWGRPFFQDLVAETLPVVEPLALSMVSVSSESSCLLLLSEVKKKNCDKTLCFTMLSWATRHVHTYYTIDIQVVPPPPSFTGARPRSAVQQNDSLLCHLWAKVAWKTWAPETPQVSETSQAPVHHRHLIHYRPNTVALLQQNCILGALLPIAATLAYT